MPGPTGVGPRRYDERLYQREIRRLVLNPLMGSLRSGIAQATSASDALRILNATGLDLELEVREYDGDPVQWVIGQNKHRRHLTALQRASCVSACMQWFAQGHQKEFERDETGQFTIPANFASMDESATQDEPGDAGATQDEEYVNPSAEPEPVFFTQNERAALADVGDNTQRRSDRYEEAGLGPEIRSGAISGAEAKRRARDPDAPKPPSQRQQWELKLEAKVLECQTEHLPLIDSLQRDLRESKAQMSEYPHERELVANEREVVIASLTSSNAELQTKLNEATRRASWFQKQSQLSQSVGSEPTA